MARLRQHHEEDGDHGPASGAAADTRQRPLDEPSSGQEKDQRGVRRRRKLGQINDNALLRPWAAGDTRQGRAGPGLDLPPSKPSKEISVALRSRIRRNEASPEKYNSPKCQKDADVSGWQDDSEDQYSEYCSSPSSSTYDTEDDSIVFLSKSNTTRSRTRNILVPRPVSSGEETRMQATLAAQEALQDAIRATSTSPAASAQSHGGSQQSCSDSASASDHGPDEPSDVFFSADEALPGRSSSPARPTEQEEDASDQPRPATPREDHEPTHRGLVSPSKKLPRIPKTPHRPSMDVFWDQDQVDGWNLEHSPRKLFQPTSQGERPATSPRKTAPKRQTKASFNSRKHAIADDFLQELDDCITGGQLRDLARPTGGVKIVWSNRLNTTAGRANWKRETVRSRTGNADSDTAVQHRHHASIELAEKVIDDENRLLNVIAHEFCHLANFMVSGITTNPHGKEFKAWARKCSQAFGDRGIQVTTKHSYEIDFKYTWECTECGMEFKRHSKSIDPSRHRCGSCKSLLKQTKPVPRATGKPSEYQVFVKEQMKIVKAENPASPQKEILRLVASRWSAETRTKRTVVAPSTTGEDMENITTNLADLVLDKTA